MARIKIAYIITGLNVGGAENMLYNLLTLLDLELFDVIIVSLGSGGELVEKIRDLHIPVYEINLHKNICMGMNKFYKIYRLLKAFNPNIIQGWMYHGNVIASIMAVILKPHPKVVWNIRQSLYNVKDEKFTTRLVLYLGKLFASRVATIVYNSHLSCQQHQNFGYKYNFFALSTNLCP